MRSAVRVNLLIEKLLRSQDGAGSETCRGAERGFDLNPPSETIEHNMGKKNE